MNIQTPVITTTSIPELMRKARKLGQSGLLDVDPFAREVLDEINTFHNSISFMQAHTPQCVSALMEVAEEAVLYTKDLEEGLERETELRKAKRCFVAALKYYGIDELQLEKLEVVRGGLSKYGSESGT